MPELKLFEVTLTYFISAETHDIALEEVLSRDGADYTSIDLREITVGYVAVPPKPKAELEIVPEVGRDEIPF